MIKAIVFDFVQTLGTASDGYKAAEKKAQKKLFEKIGINSSCWDEYIDLYRKERKEHFERSDFSRKNVWLKLCSSFDAPVDLNFLMQLEDEYWETVRKSMRLFPETLTVLKKLKENHKLGMVSNSQKDGSTKALDNSEYRKLELLFDAIVIAGEKGIPAKPDPLPFNLIIEKLGVKKDETVFVGDDLRVDIEGSKNAGLVPVWLKHYSVERNWPLASFPVPVIKQLDDLYKLDNILK
ncbi:MAG: HAD family hydrolase [Spirochaetia bacterium]|jgi:HAD superfamily hydrolase (TIGR01549 family)|nr:HAD family hydrolase [Spirochaetia bacterium]